MRNLFAVLIHLSASDYRFADVSIDYYHNNL